MERRSPNVISIPRANIANKVQASITLWLPHKLHHPVFNVSSRNIMRSTGGLESDEADGAAREAGWGAVTGAAKVRSFL